MEEEKESKIDSLLNDFQVKLESLKKDVSLGDIKLSGTSFYDRALEVYYLAKEINKLYNLPIQINAINSTINDELECIRIYGCKSKHSRNKLLGLMEKEIERIQRDLDCIINMINQRNNK